jgi:hypothetical protein
MPVEGSAALEAYPEFLAHFTNSTTPVRGCSLELGLAFPHQAVPVKAFPCPGAIVQRQIKQRKHRSLRQSEIGGPVLSMKNSVVGTLIQEAFRKAAVFTLADRVHCPCIFWIPRI